MPHYTQAIPECVGAENSEDKPIVDVDLAEETEMAEETDLAYQIKELQKKTNQLQDFVYIRIASISALAGSVFTLGIIGWYTLLTHCRNPNL
jgi:hypothetical protein